MEIYQIFYLAAVSLAILEIFTPGFIFLGFSIGFVVAGALEHFTKQQNYTLDLIVFITVSCLAIFMFRKLFYSPADFKKNNGDINQY